MHFPQSRIMVHFKCRNRNYPWSPIMRLIVFESKVPWSVPWKDYNPPEYNSKKLNKRSWADKNISDNFKPKWNTVDGKINRKSHTGEYQIQDGYPMNPEGRTGLRGRGVLGRWGPNHAADPIVTRWKRINGIKQYNRKSKLPILEVCVILRRVNKQWALPGGMVDAGEKASDTLKREFMEETMNSLKRDQKQKFDDEAINRFFSMHWAYNVYSGYVDDARNTDNAWIETVAVNFHDYEGTTVQKFQFQAGDDARQVKWLEVQESMNLTNQHAALMEKVVAVRRAHW